MENQVSNISHKAYAINSAAFPTRSTDPQYWNKNELVSGLTITQIDDDTALREMHVYTRDRLIFAVDGAEELGLSYVLLRKPSEAQIQYGQLLLVTAVFSNGMIIDGMRVDQNPKSGNLLTDLPFRLWKNRDNRTQRLYDTYFPDNNKNYTFKCAIMKVVEVSGVLSQTDAIVQPRRRQQVTTEEKNVGAIAD